MVQEATGEQMFKFIDEEIKRCGQNLGNCIGFATDGASNMCCRDDILLLCS